MIYFLPFLIILKTLGLSFVITKLFNDEEPIGQLFDLIIIGTKHKLLQTILLLLSLLLTCLKCTSFWIGLIIGGIWIATTAFIIAMIYDKFLSSWERKIKLQ